MNFCKLCNVIIDTNKTNEVTEEGSHMHEICHRLVNNLDVPCKLCGKEISGKNGIVKNIDGEGLCKFHVICYRCVECGGFANLDIFLCKDGALPFCQHCKRCDNCRSTDYNTCQVIIKNDHPSKKFLILCGVCLGKEQPKFDPEELY